MHHLFTSAVIASTGLTLLNTSTVRADLIEITLGGTVFASTITQMPVGAGATIKLTYDTAAVPQFIQNQQAFYVNAIKDFSFSCGAYVASQSGAFGQIDKYDNLGGTDGIQFQLARQAATYQYTNPKPATVSLPNVGSATFEGIIINLAAAPASAWSGYTLPSTYDFSLFTNRTILVGTSTDSAQINYGTLSYRVVPTPGAGGLLGLGSVIVSSRRRR